LADLQETSWQWNFGDGKTSTDQNPIHNYDHLGTFPVTMKVSVADGQTDTMTGSVTITAQYKISGTVKNLSGTGVKTTLTMTNTGDASVQSLQVAADGTYSVAVDPGNYKIVTDPAAPAGVFTPTQRTVAITNANKTANFTANTRKVTVSIADNSGRPVPGVNTTITGSGSIYGSLTSDATGVAKVEVTAGTFTLTPQDLHPGQGYQFVPPNASAVVSGADVAKSFVYKAAVFVTSVSPNVGPANGGTSVTVTGGGFKQGGVASVSAVKFRSLTKAVTGTSVVVQSDSVLTVTTPKAQSLFTPQDSSVSTDVRVTSGAYTSGVTTDDVFVFGNVPVVTKVAVNDGPITGGTKIKITGKHFTGATAITFEPVDALPVLKASKVTIDSDTQISVTVPGMDVSNFGRHVADVRVKAPDGKSPTGFADHYTYRPINVVQLGDSIAAGEGINYLYSYDPATGFWTPGTTVPVWDGPYPLCHQSSQAYSHYVASAIGAQLTTLACTGATYDHGVHGDQPSEGAPAQFGNYPGGPLNAKYDAANPDVVLISLGADDIVFSEVVGDCVKSHAAWVASGLHVPLVCVNGRPGAVVTADFFGNLPGVATHLTQLIHDIEQRGIDSPSGVAPKIVVQDYFDPFPADRTAYCADTKILEPSQVEYLSGLVGKLDTKIANTVRSIAATDKNVQFLELKQALLGHQWCDADPWAYGISIRTSNLELTSQAPFHPTPAGQQAIAQAVLPKVKALLTPSK
jgi:GDSL-like Lipase/Acylhydrolase family/PKD domain/IPT/TIG domain